MLDLKVTLIAAQESLAGIVQGFPYKALLTAPPVLFYSAVFGGDPYVFIAYCVAFLLDLVVGIYSAIKRQVFDLNKLSLWVVKTIVHALCILLMALLDIALIHALRGFHFPILDIVVAIMLAGEVTSTLVNLQEATGRVPPFLLKATAKLHHKASRRFEAMIDAGEEEPEEKEVKSEQV